MEKPGIQPSNGLYDDDSLPGLNMKPFGNNQVSLKFEFGAQPQGEAVSARKDFTPRTEPSKGFISLCVFLLIFGPISQN